MDLDGVIYLRNITKFEEKAVQKIVQTVHAPPIIKDALNSYFKAQEVRPFVRLIFNQDRNLQLNSHAPELFLLVKNCAVAYDLKN